MSDRPRLCVMVLGELSPRGLSRYLEEHLPNVTVEAFGRHKDFERAIPLRGDAAMALPVGLRALGYEVLRQGAHGSDTVEPYALMSFAPISSSADVKRLGIAGVLSRDQLGAIVERMLGTRPRLRITTRQEDLLGLLRFSLVEAALVPERTRDYFERRTNRQLYLRRVGAFELPGLAVLRGRGSRVVEQLARLPSGVTRILGVERWI